LWQAKYAENDVNGYVYSHETRCEGIIVACVPFRTSQDGEKQYLLRSEITPAWGDEPVLSSITGGYEGGSPDDDIIRELDEEAGYEVDRDELIRLGVSFASKSDDTIYHLYSVDLTGKEAKEAHGDGSELETIATMEWVDEDVIQDVMDPQVSVIYTRLQAREVK